MAQAVTSNTSAQTARGWHSAAALPLAALMLAAFALSACGGMSPQQQAQRDDVPFWHEETQED